MDAKRSYDNGDEVKSLCLPLLNLNVKVLEVDWVKGEVQTAIHDINVSVLDILRPEKPSRCFSSKIILTWFELTCGIPAAAVRSTAPFIFSILS